MSIETVKITPNTESRKRSREERIKALSDVMLPCMLPLTSITTQKLRDEPEGYLVGKKTEITRFLFETAQSQDQELNARKDFDWCMVSTGDARKRRRKAEKFVEKLCEAVCLGEEATTQLFQDPRSIIRAFTVEVAKLLDPLLVKQLIRFTHRNTNLAIALVELYLHTRRDDEEPPVRIKHYRVSESQIHAWMMDQLTIASLYGPRLIQLGSSGVYGIMTRRFSIMWEFSGLWDVIEETDPTSAWFLDTNTLIQLCIISIASGSDAEIKRFLDAARRRHTKP